MDKLSFKAIEKHRYGLRKTVSEHLKESFLTCFRKSATFIHSFIYFAINQKYNNSIQKYIKDNNYTIFIPIKLFTRLNVVKKNVYVGNHHW